MLRVAELMERMPLARGSISAGPDWRALADLPLEGIAADSRRVREGFLFTALRGVHADGRAFIAEAVANGAAAVLAAPGTTWPEGVTRRPLIEDPEPRRRLAELAAVFAGPGPRHIAAVTGTNGKTSTVEFLRQIWALAGEKAASLGTLGRIGPRGRTPGTLTTPDPVALAETMAGLAREGVDWVALEASSHGLAQFRLDGLRLAAAGFASFSRDHLDYHGSIAAYREAKLRLFAELLPRGAPAIAAAGLEHATFIALAQIATRRGLAFDTVGEGGSLIRLDAVRPLPEGQVLRIARAEILLPLVGRFQVDNALLAAGLALVLGDAGALTRLSALRPVRGRLERAAVLANGAAIYVDYAHTPDAIATVLTALRGHAAGKLAIVFGAGGDRDRGKRSVMGRAAASLADRAIVTDDNPRTEDPAAIRHAVLAGCPGAVEIGDRERAIAAAMSDLGPGDVLVVSGKGHEQGQIVGSEVRPFDDVAVVRRLAGLA